VVFPTDFNYPTGWQKTPELKTFVWIISLSCHIPGDIYERQRAEIRALSGIRIVMKYRVATG
jgi:hypothetical protein